MCYLVIRTHMYRILQMIPVESYESETVFRPSSSWKHKTSMLIASLQDAGGSLLGGPSHNPATIEACRHFLAACPREFHGTPDPEKDPFGNNPYVCTQTEGARAVLPNVHVFNVSTCKGPAQLQLNASVCMLAHLQVVA